MRGRLNIRARHRRLRRGSVYVLVLSTALTVTIIGLSALLAARIQLLTGAGNETTVRSRLYAQSYVDVALQRLAGDADWRKNHTSDVWTAPEVVGDATLRYKLVDEIDGDLVNDDFQPARLYAKAEIGDIARLYSVLISSPPPVNAVSNADMEDGLTDWNGAGCTLSVRNDGPHGGSAYIRAGSRLGPLTGPEQEVTAVLENGRRYYVEVWVKATTFASDQNVLIAMDTTDGLQVEYFTHDWSGTSWEKLSGTLTVSWTGTLNAAYLRVNSVVSLMPFGIDDAVLIEIGPPAPVPGTWRREVE